jgi:hypothetical protein
MVALVAVEVNSTAMDLVVLARQGRDTTAETVSKWGALVVVVVQVRSVPMLRRVFQVTAGRE